MLSTKALIVVMFSSSFLLGSSALLQGCQGIEKIINNNKSQQLLENKLMVSTSNLANYDWKLSAAKDKNEQPLAVLDRLNDQVSVNFNLYKGQQRIGFTVGCNRMGSNFSLSKNVLKLGNIFSTEIYCQDLDLAEKKLNQLMATESKVSIEPKVNQIKMSQQFVTGETLIWDGRPTAEVRYNQQGDIIFWEVSHELQTCPATNLKNCLKVRPVYYDTKGLKQSVGDWNIFVDKIDGYKHDSRVNTILRLKRFIIDPVDVKGKQFVYVLDSIAESLVAE
ncbi:META domain-containing protein [Psychrobacter sp.]|uniref:META domain-containing protein n=1 Tax=Psychrobacter sp. TaxID=56811 RepID=UPI002600EDC1|nr:META domain-containing protein [Psychrobacter sp.]